MKGIGEDRGPTQDRGGIAVKDEVESANETTRFDVLRFNVMRRSLNS
jgi:hypothetical protein